MERAGRSLEEAELRAAMRECGLGTPATRAATIETLLRRNYLRREKKTLIPLPLGRSLIDALPVEALESPRLTGEWEARLADYPESGLGRRNSRASRLSGGAQDLFSGHLA